MRWEPLLIILLLAGLTGLFILATHYRKHWLTWLVWGYLTSLGAILFTPLAFTGTAVYIIGPGSGQVNLTHLDMLNLGFFENIIMKIPLGILLKWIWPKLSLWRLLELGGLAGTFFETTQYILSQHWLINRSSDINDVISNTLGVIVGGMVVALYYRLTALHHRKPLTN